MIDRLYRNAVLPGAICAGLVTIEDTGTMEVRCSLQLEDLYWLAGGDEPLAGPDPTVVSPGAIWGPEAAEVLSRVRCRKS